MVFLTMPIIIRDRRPTLVSYCRTRYDFDQTEGPSSTHWWLDNIQTTYNWKNQYGAWLSRPLSKNSYTYDDCGQRLTDTITSAVLNPDGSPQFNQDGSAKTTSRTENYGYDELNRLTSVNYGDGQTQG